ncbi:MAG: GntR family transcriptional regulator [Synergistaceae bacterium]|nr:GntR family transcriptional regulator [Synergistaceae bacterium]
MQYNEYNEKIGGRFFVDRGVLSPAMSQGLRQIVYEKLRSAIVDGSIKPGTKLSEIDLAERLEVSRTPIREAIRQLGQTGLVTLEPRKGAFVTMPSLKDASDLYDLREELEVMASVNLCKADHSEELTVGLQRFRSIFGAMTDDTITEEYVREDKAFHSLIYKSVTNKYLANTLANIADLIHLCRPFSLESSRVTNFIMGHEAIVDAVLKRDIDRAVEETRKHIALSRQSLIASLKIRAKDALREVTDL